MASRRSPPRLIAIEGPTGVGKSRLALALSERIPGAIRLPEAYDRLSRPPSLEVPDREELLFVERRLFREELRRYRDARRARSEGRTVIADTGFLGPLTYSIGLARLDPARDVAAPMAAAMRRAAVLHTLGMPDLTLHLGAPASALRGRILGDPTGHPEPLATRHLRVGRTEAQLWNGPIARVLGARYRPVSARGPEDQVELRALERIDRSTVQPPLRPAEASELLEAVVDALGVPSVTVKKRGRRAPTPRR